MKVANAATYFDRVQTFDAYDASLELFKGQFDLFDDSKRDGSTVTRRVLATGPDPTTPDRGVVSVANGDVYVLGKRHPDWFDGEIIREKFILFPVTELVQVGNEEQVLGATARTMYGGRVWIKNLKETLTSSEKFPIYNIYTSLTETIAPNELMYVEGRWHRVMSVFESAAGFRAAESAELAADAVTTLTFTPRAGLGNYDPVTDAYTTSAPVAAVPAIVERFQTFYEYEQEATPRAVSGDIRVSVLQADINTVVVGSTFVIGSDKYEVISAVLHGTAWHIHARPVQT